MNDRRLDDHYLDDNLMLALRAADPATNAPPASPHDPQAIALLNRILASDRDRRRRWPLSLIRASQSHSSGRSNRTRRAVLAGALVVVSVGGFIALRSPWTSTPAPVTRSAGTTITTAMVEDIATASRAAVAHSGIAQVRFTNTDTDAYGAPLQVAAGTASTEFSGPNVSIASEFTINPGSQAGGTAAYASTLRIVAGRMYWLSGGRWYVAPDRLSPIIGVLQPYTDPRAFLQMLSPSADFQRVDGPSVGGVALTHLRAANHDLTIPIQLAMYGAVARVSALDVWVDNAGVVHHMNFTMSISSSSYSMQTSAPPTTITQVIALSFSQLGDPETISAPVHATIDSTGGPDVPSGYPPAPCPQSVCAVPSAQAQKP